MLESILNTPPQPKKKEEKEGENGVLEVREKQEGSWLYRVGLGLARYITKPVFEGRAKLEYTKPLSILERHEAEIAKNKEASKLLSSEQGGPTKEEIYISALMLAKELGWKEKMPTKNDSESVQVEESKKPYSTEASIPLFITKKLRLDLKAFGVTDDEIAKLKPAEAWDLLEQKTLSKEIQEQRGEKIYSTEQVGEDFSVLQKMWEEAYDRMDSVNEDKRTVEILDVTTKTFDDPKPLEDFLRSEGHTLKPEEKLFIEMSIQIKRFRAKAKDLLIDEEIKSSNIISKEDFQRFIDTNEVSENILQTIAQKIIEGKQIAKEEMAIYSEKTKEIEEIVSNAVAK